MRTSCLNLQMNRTGSLSPSSREIQEAGISIREIDSLRSVVLPKPAGAEINYTSTFEIHDTAKWMSYTFKLYIICDRSVQRFLSVSIGIYNE